ncbi:CDP-glycerol glycerophosphotransferase family protein [Leucobacter sp. L43]|uniref:bifunctional glycosyltransferase/CDP-glycerol:glycerophosphate glycerophosphotransferase n=1 Tax=Leucobacter sp. L43 TaxID=2798040 RepID=UPI0019074E57|nr:CDP-glycerol glycerophosphotransferase family protein [Leucobacter sp. L43]
MEHGSLESVRVTSNRSQPDQGPFLSLIVPCYRVSEYLPDFLLSLDEQAQDADDLEVIFVVDGCPEDSEAILREWAERSPILSTISITENGGVSRARNHGLGLARGDWVSFPDPDDELAPSYLEEVRRAIAQNNDVTLVATRLVQCNAQKTRVLNHPLDFRYANGSRVVDLNESTDFLQIAVHTAFFRREVLSNSGVSFDPRLKVLEDGKFVAEYLLAARSTSVFVCSEAHYYYKVRRDGTSALQKSAQNLFERYVSTLEYAHLALLQDLRSPDCPFWLANILLYDLYWLFAQYQHMHSTLYSISAESQRELSDLASASLKKIGLTNIRSFRAVNTPLDIRAAWEARAADGVTSKAAILRRYDPVRQLQKIVFHSSQVNESFSVVRGESDVFTPYRKAREILFFDEVWVFEHIVWADVSNDVDSLEPLRLVSKNETSDFLFDGVALEARITGRALGKVPPGRGPQPVISGLTPRKPKRSNGARFRQFRARLPYVLAFRVSRFSGQARAFRNAWVLMDRDVQANDNGEALYRYLMENRPDINAWFVINRDSPDWKRLKRDGFKLAAYRSKKHFSLMKHARVLASSMLDEHIVTPFPRKYLPQTWIFSFLQHGVTHNSVHRWLNLKKIDHIVTSTVAEHEFIAGSPSPFSLSERETVLSGMPRHDRLFKLSEAAKRSTETTKTVVVMPTWRKYLAPLLNSDDGLQGFHESRFVTEWSAMFNSSVVRDLIRREEVRFVLLPHPGIDEHWKDLKIPNEMDRISYVGDDIQSVLASASLVITDYSSQAFEGAFAEAPTLYFQFDREEFYSGGHIGSEGYFDHARDGFGPVSLDLHSLEADLVSMLDHSHPSFADYKRRISALYPLRDGNASKRVVAAIEERLQPIKR